MCLPGVDTYSVSTRGRHIQCVYPSAFVATRARIHCAFRRWLLALERWSSQCTMHTGIHILTHAETRHTGSAGRKNKSDGRKKKDHRSQALTAGNCVRVCVSTRVPMHTCRDTYQIDRYVSIYVCECVYAYIWRHIPARAARDAASEPGICGELRT